MQAFNLFTLCVNLRTVTVLRPVVFFPHQQKNHLSGGFVGGNNRPTRIRRFLYLVSFTRIRFARFIIGSSFANGYGSSPCCLFPTPTKKTTFQVAFVGGNNRATRTRNSHRE